MELTEREVSRQAEKAYDGVDVITLQAGDTLKIESDGVEHLALSVPTDKQHVVQIQVHICETSVG